MRKLIGVTIAGTLVAGAMCAAVLALPEAQLIDPGKLPPVVECLNGNGDVVALIPNPIYEVPGDADTAAGC